MKREFDGKTLAILAVGLCVVMVLTFMAGIVTGLALWIPTRRELAALKDHGAAQPALPAVAAIRPPASTTTAAAPPPAPTVAPIAAEPPKPAETAPVAEKAPPVAVAAAPAAAPTPAPAPEADVFSLQLGSFLDPKNARQLQTELKERGYNSTIFTALDGEQREWHVVRIGGFRTMSSAATAAATFTGKERIAAFVRHSDKL